MEVSSKYNLLANNILTGGSETVALALLKKKASFLLLALTRRSVGPLFLGAQSPVLEGSAGDALFALGLLPRRSY
jgi:hypothetical protein